MYKALIAVGILTLILGGVIGYFLGYGHGLGRSVQENILSFDECKAAGYPIMEIYPEQCAVPGGKTFVREIKEEPPQDIGGEGWGVPDGPMPPETIAPRQGPGDLACPMDAKLCPDGSAVGRTGPNCEFAPCPSEETPY